MDREYNRFNQSINHLKFITRQFYAMKGVLRGAQKPTLVDFCNLKT